MDALKIVTNNRPRDVLDWYDLSTRERSGFDYLDTEDRQHEAQFARYRGAVYDLDDMERHGPMPVPLVGWDNYRNDSCFSGVVIRWCKPDYDQVVFGRFCS